MFVRIGWIFVSVLCVSGVSGQTWNSNAGGWNTGYGTVYGTFGLAQATQNIYNTTQLNMQRAIMRQAMIKKWGLAAVEKAEREARAGTQSTGPRSSTARNIQVTPPPVVRNYGVFRPDATVDTGKTLADALGSTPEEKTLIKQIFVNTKAAYEKETAAKIWKNNIAGGMTFFAVTAMTVYRDSEEPSDEAVDAFFEVMKQSIDDLPEFASVSNKEKQAYNNLLIGFSGLLLAGYIEGKQNGDSATLQSYSQLAAGLIKMVLRIEADRLQVKDGNIVIL